MFVIELATLRVQIVGRTRHPNDAFMLQAVRTMTALDDGALAHCCVLVCERDWNWSAAVRQSLEESAVRVAQTPFQAPNCNHQGLDNEIIDGQPSAVDVGVRRRQRLGGLLNYYCRAA